MPVLEILISPDINFGDERIDKSGASFTLSGMDVGVGPDGVGSVDGDGWPVGLPDGDS